MELLNRVNSGETVKISCKIKVGEYLKNKIIANIFYIALWVAFDVFFVYLLTKENISSQFWFITIPICGLNLLTIWVFIFNLIKLKSEMNNRYYILTDKAFYYCQDEKYKETKRIELSDIVVVEKSEYLCEGFYVASLNDNIHVVNIKEEKVLFDALVQHVKQTEE